MKNKVIAIILARGGSKGIPRKNVLEFAGHPLVAWSVIQAKQTTEIDEVYISSDSDEILEIAQSYGAKIIKRPDEISGDSAKSEEAITHALSILGSNQEMIIMLEPTAPLREADDLDNCVRMFRTEGWDSCFSGATLQDFLIWKRDKNGELISVNYDYKNRQMRQAIARRYLENGSFYIFKTELIRQTTNRLGGNIGIYKMAKYKMYQIDDLDDVKLCEVIMSGYGLVD